MSSSLLEGSNKSLQPFFAFFVLFCFLIQIPPSDLNTKRNQGKSIQKRVLLATLDHPAT